MRPIIRFVLPALVVLAVTACHQQAPQTSSVAPQTHVAPPSNATDAPAWEAYMVKVSHADLRHIAAKPYLFEVLAKSDPRASQHNLNTQQALTGMAKTDRFPGNAIAIGGPDPNATADIAVAAFGAATPGSLKGLTVLYIGDENNKARVAKVITTAGATFRFAAM